MRRSPVQWDKVFECLGIEMRATVLPARCKCVLCGRPRHVIFRDSCLGGQWHYCEDCKFAGDTLRLVGEVRGLKPKESMLWLKAQGVLPDMDISEYLHNLSSVLEIRNKGIRLANKILGHTALTTAGQRMLYTLGVHSEVPKEWAKKTMGRLFGSFDHAETEAILIPSARRWSDISDRYVQGRVGSTVRLFVGRDWEDVLIAPIQRFPGRLIGFWITGRSMTEEDTRLWMPNDGSKVDYVGGFFYHRDIPLKSRKPLYLMSDMIRSIKLHTKNYRLSPEHLPLATYIPKSGKMGRAWQAFNRPMIFWTPELDSQTLRYAFETNSRVSMAGSRQGDKGRLDEFFSRFTPREALHQMGVAAREWPVIFKRAIGKLADDAVEILLLNMELDSSSLRRFLNKCDSETQRRCHDILRDQLACPAIISGSIRIEERNGCWINVDPGNGERLLLEAVIRIDSVIRYSNSERVVYKGYVIYQGHEVPFCEERGIFEKDTIRYIQDLVMTAGHGVITGSIYKPSRLSNIAMQFQKPELITGFDNVGWDANNSSFVTPNYRVEMGGNTEKHEDVTIKGTPGRIPLPEEPTRDRWEELLEDTTEVKLFWAAWLGIVANLIAPACNRKPIGVAISGSSSAYAARAALRACDCQLLVNRIGKEYPHNTYHWPRGIDIEQEIKSHLRKESLQRIDNNCLLRTNDIQAAMLGVSDEWMALRADSENLLPVSFGETARWVLPAYLKRLMSHKLERPTMAMLHDEVAADMADWLESTYLDASVIVQAAQLLNAGSGANAFALLICLLHQKGECEILPKEFKQPATVWRTDDGLFVPRSLLVRHISHYDAPPLDINQATKVLLDAGVLIGDTTINSKHGWLIDESWWSRYAAALRAEQAATLKVQGVNHGIKARLAVARASCSDDKKESHSRGGRRA